jgi:acyl-CoA thioester hydrolase
MTSSRPGDDDTPFHFSTELRVRLPETDAMGIVFHGNYFIYLDVGRVDYLRNLGLTEDNRPIRDFDNVVVSAHLDFKSPARLHDVLAVDVRIGEIRNASFRFDFRIRHKRRNAVVAQGYTTHCAVDREFRPMRVPDAFRSVIADFERWNA